MRTPETRYDHADAHAPEPSPSHEEPARRRQTSASRPTSQRSAVASEPGTSGFASAVNTGIHDVSGAVAGGGKPLDPSTRTRMETGFGTDLSHVRVHDHGAAASSAASMGAQAYALGNNIVFGSGNYQPSSQQGSWLLAHELGHTIQQRDVSQQAIQRKAIEVGTTNDAHEVAADSAATRVMAGETGVASSLSTSEAVIRRFTTPVPWPESSPLWGGSAFARHEVHTNAEGVAFPAGQPASPRVRFDNHDASVNVPAGSGGTLQILGSGDYTVNNGTFLESIPDRGDYRFRTDWHYRAGEDRALTFEDNPAITHSETPMPLVFRTPVSVTPTGMQGDHQVTTRLTFTQAPGGTGPTVGGGIGVVSGSTPLPAGANGVGSFPIDLRLHVNVTGGHDPAPATDRGGAHASASAEAHSDASATASVVTPMPAAVHAPDTHEEYFEEGQTQGDTSALIRWAATVPDAAQAAIRTQRLRVTALGFASTTGNESRNLRVYAQGRASWVRGILAMTWGVPESQIQIGTRGDATAPASDHVPHGVANRHERRVEIHFEEVAPMEAVHTTASRDAHASAVTGTARSAP